MLKQKTRRFKIYAVYIAGFFVAIAFGNVLMLSKFLYALGESEDFIGQVISMGTCGVFIGVFAASFITEKVDPCRIAATGSLLYGLGIILVLYLHSFVWFLYIAGFLFGFGWGVVYTLCPILINDWVNKQEKAFYFSFLVGVLALGMAIAPILTDPLLFFAIPSKNMFLLSFGLCVISCVIFIYLALVNAANHHRGVLNIFQEWQRLQRIIVAEAKYPLCIALLCGGIFGSMMNFQPLFSLLNNLDISVYFFCYTFAIITMRMIVSKSIPNANTYTAVLVLFAIMGSGFVLFLFVGSNIVLYALASFFYGAGYSLIYPIVQTLGIHSLPNKSDEKRYLGYFCLSYFIGVYGIPYIAGNIIVLIGYIGLIYFCLSMAMIAMACIEWRRRIVRM